MSKMSDHPDISLALKAAKYDWRRGEVDMARHMHEQGKSIDEIAVEIRKDKAEICAVFGIRMQDKEPDQKQDITVPAEIEKPKFVVPREEEKTEDLGPLSVYGRTIKFTPCSGDQKGKEMYLPPIPDQKDEYGRALGIARILREQGGATLQLIADALNAAKYCTKTGKPFTGSIVSQICKGIQPPVSSEVKAVKTLEVSAEVTDAATPERISKLVKDAVSASSGKTEIPAFKDSVRQFLDEAGGEAEKVKAELDGITAKGAKLKADLDNLSRIKHCLNRYLAYPEAEVSGNGSKD